MKTLKDFKRELLADPAARAEYEAQSAEFTMTRELIVARKDVVVVALHSRRQFERESEYRDHREKAIAAQVLVVTHAAAFIDSFSPGYAGLRILAQSALLRVQAAM